MSEQLSFEEMIHHLPKHADARKFCPKGCGELIYPRGLAAHISGECDVVQDERAGANEDPEPRRVSL